MNDSDFSSHTTKTMIELVDSTTAQDTRKVACGRCCGPDCKCCDRTTHPVRKNVSITRVINTSCAYLNFICKKNIDMQQNTASARELANLVCRT